MIKLTHGGDIYTAEERLKGQVILDFSANINPLGLPDGVKKAAAGAIERSANYPDPLCRELRRALARKERVDEKQFVFGNGAADLIFRLAAVRKPERALLLAPTFAEYAKALQTVDCQIESHYLFEETGFRLQEDILPKLNGKIDMVFLCNPNNPTGQLMDHDLLLRILDRCREEEIFLVVDECFLDFLEEPEVHTLKGYLDEYPNLFLLRAFTKSYAMAGLRLGYGICSDQKLLEKIFATGQPWSVSIVAQEAGVQALDETDYLERARELVFKEKEFLQEQLAGFGYAVFPAAANYIFFRLRKCGDLQYAETFPEDLARQGILIRSCANYAGLGNDYFRIAVKTGEENEQLLAAIKEREKLWQNR